MSDAQHEVGYVLFGFAEKSFMRVMKKQKDEEIKDEKGSRTLKLKIS